MINLRKLCLLWVGIYLSTHGYAATQAFVPLKPTEVKRDDSATLNWLRTGNGDDGYVRAVASIDLDAPCLPAGKSGWAATIGKEKIQLAVFVKLSGLASPLADKEVPMVLVDGREDPGGCLELNAPKIVIVPTTKLQRGSPSDPISVEVKVRTASNKELNLVSSAQAALTIASLFASPAAAISISGASSVLAEPVIGSAEKYMERKMEGKVPAQASYKFSIGELRKGVVEIPFAVYSGEYGLFTNLPSSEAAAIPLIQVEKRNSKEDPIFWVKLSLYYTQSLFTLPSKLDGTPIGAEIQDSIILNYPNLDADSDDLPSVFQLLSANNPQEPSLLTYFSLAKNPIDFKNGCERALAILNKKGFNLLDRSLILRSFINVARSDGGWYGTPLSTGCTQGNPGINASWLAVFGPTPPILSPTGIEAMARPPAGQDKAYDAWLKKSLESLNYMRTALRASDNKDVYLLKATKGHDLSIVASKAATAWPEQEPEPTQKPWISRLSAKRLKAVGCFSFPYADASFDSEIKAGSFLMLDAAGVVWVARPEFSPLTGGGFAELEIFQLNSAWKKWHDDLFQYGLIGSTGDCKLIVPALAAAPLAAD